MRYRYLILLPLLAACDSPTEPQPEPWTYEGNVTAASISFGHVDPAASVECQVAEPGGAFNAIPVLADQSATGPVCRHYFVGTVQPDGTVEATYPLYIAGAPIGGRYRVRVK